MRLLWLLYSRARWCPGSDDARAFPHGEYLVGFHVRNSLNLLRGRPLYFDRIDHFDLPEAEMKAQIALRHHAGAAVNFIHLNMLAGDHAYAGSNRGAVACGAY